MGWRFKIVLYLILGDNFANDTIEKYSFAEMATFGIPL